MEGKGLGYISDKMMRAAPLDAHVRGCNFFCESMTGSTYVERAEKRAISSRTDRPAHLDVAALGQMSFAVFLLAPPLLGFVTEHADVRMSYLICLPLIAGALLSVRALAGRRKVTAISVTFPKPDQSSSHARQSCTWD
jgi:hypothetical protein